MMEKKTEYCLIIPHDDLSSAFLKHFEKKLADEGFHRSFEHMDPGGVDIYRYQSGDKLTIVVTRKQMEGDKEKLDISSEWSGLSKSIAKAADEFGSDIAAMIKKGGPKK
jgi:hypothetical protein